MVCAIATPAITSAAPKRDAIYCVKNANSPQWSDFQININNDLYSLFST
jgi:hypothetical protein